MVTGSAYTLILSHNTCDPSYAPYPIVQRNVQLSTNSTAVFDVIATHPELLITGCVLKMEVDSQRFMLVPVPDGNLGSLMGNISTGGFGGNYGLAVVKEITIQGDYEGDYTNYYLMSTAIQAPGLPQPANGILMRFALKIRSQTFTGLRMLRVEANSGLMDPDGYLIFDTEPCVGQLEVLSR